MNFVFLLFVASLLRKYLQTEKQQPKWDKLLVAIRNFSAILFAAEFFFKHYSPTFQLIWDLIYVALLYFLYENRNKQIANILFWAALPFVVAVCADDFMKFWFPNFHEEYDNFFEMGVVFSFIWMISYGFGASKQYKNLQKEQEKREKEEEENRKILARKDQLELMVQERTAEILLQKQSLEKTLEELRETQNQLIQKEKLASLGELTAGIAHEIQNPLNFVNNFSELSVGIAQDLQEEMKRPDKDEAYIDELLSDLTQNQEKINHHGKRASNIVKGMLEHSRASTGERVLTNINDLCDEYLRLSYHGMRAKNKSFNADFKTNFDENLPKIEVIPQDLGRVLLNLINNAFYVVNQRNTQNVASQPQYQPTVIISTKKSESQIEIIVKDNGTGMSEATKAKIFQPFFTTKPTGEGTGLGLSLSYDIITKGHGGTLEVESVEGEGTTFIVKLPIVA